MLGRADILVFRYAFCPIASNDLNCSVIFPVICRQVDVDLYAGRIIS